MKLLLPALAVLGATSSAARADAVFQTGTPVGQMQCHTVPATEPGAYPNVVRDKLDWPACTFGFADLWMDLVDASHDYWAGSDTAGHAVMVYFNRASSNGKLLVLLAGTPASTKTYTAFGQRAARAGYHVILLPYWNADDNDDDATIDYPDHNWGSSPYKCNATSTPDACMTSFYDYTTAGVALPANLVGLDEYSPPGGGLGAPEDSVAHRLAVTLEFLAAGWPAQGWSTFLDGGGHPRWGQVVMAGQSHGCAGAARLAHAHALQGAIFLEGPNDYLGTATNPTAPSFLAPGATDGSRMWLLDNTSDSGRLPRVQKNIDAMGLGTVGSAGKQIDSTTTFTGVTAHRLWAHAIADGANGTPASCDAHMSTSTGCNGYFDAAWDYLLDQAAQ